jgi:hypothetical protein
LDAGDAGISNARNWPAGRVVPRRAGGGGIGRLSTVPSLLSRLRSRSGHVHYERGGEKPPLSEGDHGGGVVGGSHGTDAFGKASPVLATNSVARATSAASSMLMLRVRLS